MFGWIARSALPEASLIDWIFDVYDWLLEETGGIVRFAERPLVLPTTDFFPLDDDLEGEELAHALYDAAREHAGLSDCRCRLEAHEEEEPLPLSAAFGAMKSRGAAGTFSRHGARDGVITYAPSKLDDPAGFVATMAHELGHFLMSRFRGEPPGGDEALEPATDICAVFMGFGVFQANSAFQFQQFQDGNMQGWRTSRLGYLDEKALSYALAIFLALRGLDAAEARRHLKDNPRSYLKHALRHLEKERAAELDELRAETSS
jgi:hypothetical protein